MEANNLAGKLEQWFTKIEKAAIALSGGIDSSLVAFVSRKVLGKTNTVAVISASASLKARELDEARQFCNTYDIVLREIDSGEINDPMYRQNPVNRCYFCKSALYSKMDQLVSGLYKDFAILNGNNFSDLGDYRPGLRAAEDHRILSPLAICDFRKDDIRELARYYGLPNWNKPASPCLSSRFPYGEPITVEKLKRVESAEDLLVDSGFGEVRVRHIGNSARIEVPSERISELQQGFDEIRKKILSFGFENCEIDNEGLVSGKLNRKLKVQ
jgi:pyridinium-3,5-biscarboxylic acid mononucleotide sulfurtransferase